MTAALAEIRTSDAPAYTPEAAGEPLRILHVLRAPLGGLFRHVVDLTRAQTETGHLVGLVADSTTGGAGADRTLAELAPSLALGLLRLPMRRPPHPADLQTFQRIARHIRMLRPDVVHGHGSKGGLFARLDGFLPGSSGRVRGYTPHGGSFNYRPGTAMHRLYMAVEKILASRTDILLFESRYIAERFEAYVGASPRSLQRIVPNGIGPGEFVPVEPAADAAEFVYIGELRAAKGIDTLLIALAELSRRRPSPPRLALVGSGPDTESLRQQASALHLDTQVHFHGPKPARFAFTLGRVLVVPSRAESLPYIVLEAAGARIPLVATNVGGIPEIFGPYADRLIPCDDPARLAEAMTAELDRDPAQALRRAGELADFVQGRFSFSNMVDAVVEGYRAALDRKGRRRAPA